jgi:hypothetical protein
MAEYFGVSMDYLLTGVSMTISTHQSQGMQMNVDPNALKAIETNPENMGFSASQCTLRDSSTPYKVSRDDLEFWKNRALAAEKKLEKIRKMADNQNEQPI